MKYCSPRLIVSLWMKISAFLEASLCQYCLRKSHAGSTGMSLNLVVRGKSLEGSKPGITGVLTATRRCGYHLSCRWIGSANRRSSPVGIAAFSLKHDSDAAPLQHFKCRLALRNSPVTFWWGNGGERGNPSQRVSKQILSRFMTSGLTTKLTLQNWTVT